jgi:hypothetical protein
MFSSTGPDGTEAVSVSHAVSVATTLIALVAPEGAALTADAGADGAGSWLAVAVGSTSSLEQPATRRVRAAAVDRLAIRNGARCRRMKVNLCLG